MMTRVVKLGGSLLEWSDLRAAFFKWLENQPPAVNLIVTGGGELVEAVRRLDKVHTMDPSSVHWHCVDLMMTTGRIASQILAIDNVLVAATEIDRVQKAAAMQTAAIVLPTAYYTAALAAEQKCPLPESWDTTSDSLAAWLACCVGAAELVLLKSTSHTATSQLTESELRRLSREGIVDAAFPTLLPRITACGLAVRFVNLRAA